MKADKILVVMDGKIIEQGSHEELLRLRGKFYDLWSAQIFIKPDSTRSRSGSPDKQKSRIVNDLSPALHKAELARVMNVTGPEGASGDSSKKETDGKKTSSGHKREVSPGDEQ